MATPTIAMIPSGYKAGTVYSVLPVDGTGDFDFTRASSATRVNESGLIETVATGVPRLDYTGGGCPSLLLEPQSTNLIPYSEAFDNAAWSKTRCTIDSGGHTSPSGESDAFKMTATDDDARLQDGSEAAGVVYTQSIYVKSATGSNVSGQVDFTGVDIQTFTATNEWQRVDSILSDMSKDGVVRVRITNNGDELYIYGAQLEQQSYATSYIPTSGSTVTRIADAASKTGLSSYINSSEGVLYAEISALANDGTNRRLSINKDQSNRIAIEFKTDNTLQFSVRETNVFRFFEIVALDITVMNKFALQYKSGDSTLWVNGSKIATKTEVFDFTGNELINLAFNDGGGAEMFSNCKDLRVYNAILTDPELTTLTTL